MLSGIMTRRRSSENSKHCWRSLFVSFHVEPLVAHHLFGAEVDGRKVMGHPERCVKTWVGLRSKWLMDTCCLLLPAIHIKIYMMSTCRTCEFILFFYANFAWLFLLFHLVCSLGLFSDSQISHFSLDGWVLATSHPFGYQISRTSAKAGQLGIIPGSTKLKMSKWDVFSSRFSMVLDVLTEF